MTEAHIKERLSTDFISILAHHQGYLFNLPELDYGVDFEIGAIKQYRLKGGNERFFQTSHFLNFQLKSTIEKNVEMTNEVIKYHLSVKNYNDLIFRKKEGEKKIGGHIPLILLCHIFPFSVKDCVELDESKIVLHGKVFWFYPSSDMDFSTNKKTQVIEIPLKNQLNLDFLPNMFRLYHKIEL